MLIALLCGFAGQNFASSMGNISFSFQSQTSVARWHNGGLGNSWRQCDGADCAAGYFFCRYLLFSVRMPQPDGSCSPSLTPPRDSSAVTGCRDACRPVWYERYRCSSKRLLPRTAGAKRSHLWPLGLLYRKHYFSVIHIGFSAGFAMPRQNAIST